ncbi:MAG: hypothetical protein M1820_010449 [Bogoriella megaspora]|nr:MAG: hypothetical protein M1820_010449 [Bogoriella megaspora]
MRRRQQTYTNLHGLASERDAVAWYWRVIAFAASWMILGGYLVIAPTVADDTALRISKTALSIFGICLFAAGYILTVILYFACRSSLFQGDAIFLPALTSSSLGLLTILYTFLVHSHTTWTAVPILSLVVAAVSTIFYSILLLLTHRRISRARAIQPLPTQSLLNTNTAYQPESSGSNATTPPINDLLNGSSIPWQSPQFYQNYLANMFPTAQKPQGDPLLTEEELTRQQMLMLLMKADAEAQSGQARENGTFRIDLNLPDDDDSAQPTGPGVPYPQATELAARRYTQQLQLQQQHLQQQIAAQRMAGGNSISSMDALRNLQNAQMQAAAVAGNNNGGLQPPPTGLGFLERMTQGASGAYQAVRGAAGGGQQQTSAWDVRARSEERERGRGQGNMGGMNRAKSREEREARRREIELGMR